MHTLYLSCNTVGCTLEVITLAIESRHFSLYCISDLSEKLQNVIAMLSSRNGPFYCSTYQLKLFTFLEHFAAFLTNRKCN